MQLAVAVTDRLAPLPFMAIAMVHARTDSLRVLSANGALLPHGHTAVKNDLLLELQVVVDLLLRFHNVHPQHGLVQFEIADVPCWVNKAEN